MTILAIDPGNEKSAYVVWDGSIIISKGIKNNYDVLTILTGYHDKEITCVIEMVASYGMPVGKTVFETCVWIGRFHQAWQGPVKLLYRKDVKMYLCQSMRAKDSNIRQALIDKFGKPGTIKAPNLIYAETAQVKDKMKADLWAALAVAVTWSES